MQEYKELPRYQCHKIVEALKISEILEVDDGFMLVFEEDGYDPIIVSDDWVKRHRPDRGGYYVVYPDSDGYTSFSPAAPFEAGYTRIPE